jgi:hypothetical protein
MTASIDGRSKKLTKRSLERSLCPCIQPSKQNLSVMGEQILHITPKKPIDISIQREIT